MAVTRLTSEGVEVLHDGAAKARVSGLGLEALHAGVAKARVSALGIEVLRPVGLTIENMKGGAYSGSNSSPNNAVAGGTIDTLGANRLIVIVCLTSRANTVADVNEVTAITASGLTFTRAFHDVSWTYNDAVGASSFPVASHSIDIFTAPAPANVSGVTWTSTMAGDGFVNHGSVYQFAISGLYDITKPFDPGMLTPITQKNASGTASAPQIAGISTTNANDLLVAFFANHNGTTDATPAAGAGWSVSGPINNSGDSSGHKSIVQSKNVFAPQSNITIPTGGYSDKYWYGAVLAFTADPPIPKPVGPWNSTELPDAMSVQGYAGYRGPVGDMLSTEAKDALSAAGYQKPSGELTVAEAPDTFSAYGFQPQKGAMASTEAKDRFSAAGVGLGVNGTWSSTEAADTLAIAAKAPVSGTFDVSGTPDRFQATGSGVTRVRRRRTLTVT